jgi:hypothetical protein
MSQPTPGSGVSRVEIPPPPLPVDATTVGEPARR